MSLIDPNPRTIPGIDRPVGRIGYGCWRLTGDDLSASRGLIETALEHGLDLIDTADVYGLDWGGTGFGENEERLGAVLRDAPGLRERMVLVTKGGIAPPTPYNSGPGYLADAIDASLRRLQTDYVDLYLIHRPDLFTHPAAAGEALEKMIEAGKVRAVGISNYTAAQHDALQAHMDTPLSVIQPEMSAVALDPLFDGTLDAAMRHGAVPLAWSPLAGGRLATGEGVAPELMELLHRLAEREGVHNTVIALGFVLAHPSRPIALVGTQTPERIVEATQALDVSLDRNDVYEIIQTTWGPLP